MRPGVSKTCVCAVACCHFVCHPQEIRAVPGYPLLRSPSEPPNHYYSALPIERVKPWFTPLRPVQAVQPCNSLRQPCSIYLWAASSVLHELLKGTPPFPVGNRKWIGNRGVNRHGTGWLGHSNKYTIWPERLATDLSLCNVSQTRLNSVQQEPLGVSLRIKADCVRGPRTLHVDSKLLFCLFAIHFTELESG